MAVFPRGNTVIGDHRFDNAVGDAHVDALTDATMHVGYLLVSGVHASAFSYSRARPVWLARVTLDSAKPAISMTAVTSVIVAVEASALANAVVECSAWACAAGVCLCPRS